MKTFFNITIEGLGDTQTFRIQSTKLRKFDQNAKYGFYRLKNTLNGEGMYVNQQQTLCSVNVELEEVDVMPCNCTLFVDVR